MLSVWFAGLRGAIAFVLSTTLNSQTDNLKNLLQTTTLAIVLITSVLFGALTEPFIRFMRMRGQDLKEDLESEAAALEEAAVAAALAESAEQYEAKQRTQSEVEGAGGSEFTANEAVSGPMSEQYQELAGNQSTAYSALGTVNKTFELWKQFDERYMREWFGGRRPHNDLLHKKKSLAEMDNTHEGYTLRQFKASLAEPEFSDLPYDPSEGSSSNSRSGSPNKISKLKLPPLQLLRNSFGNAGSPDLFAEDHNYSVLAESAQRKGL